MDIYEYLPYSKDRKVRKQVQDLFSREVLGAVIVGKYTGDYAAILITRYFGTDIGYILGIIFSISLFVYWDIIEKKTQESKEKIKEGAEEATGKVKEKADKSDDEPKVFV